ncbi:MAG TPA: hypothetical protein PL001_07875 [Candidatus Kryptobacter bacterium]|nr:MAG: hypothetical protein B7Z63_02770 [Ignavibacteriae bacterium 37-53-5]HQT91931.1 hypothetical protein [Candidatus Kryptobacter bacterium]
MARQIFYRIRDDGKNFVSGEEWDAIKSLQHWYNSEFFWTGGRLNLRRFVVFPNYDLVGKDVRVVRSKFLELEKAGYSEEEIVDELESKRFIIVKRGGYEDGMIASGHTRVADNELNAFLVLDFLLKVSRIARTSLLEVHDEGSFVKTHGVDIANGDVIVGESRTLPELYEEAKGLRRIFAVVNPDKYDGHPEFTNRVNEFNELLPFERAKVVEDWNWLGYESKADFDFNGDDFFGFDLNRKICHLFFK